MFKTFDDVELQYSLPNRCVHVLTKDCTKNNTFMVLISKEPEKPDKKIIEIFVEKEKIRIEPLENGRYQIQVGFPTNRKTSKTSHKPIQHRLLTALYFFLFLPLWLRGHG